MRLILLAPANSASQCGPAGTAFWESARQYFADLRITGAVFINSLLSDIGLLGER